MSDVEKLVKWLAEIDHAEGCDMALQGCECGVQRARELAAGALTDTEELLEFIDYEGAMAKYIRWCTQEVG